MRLFFIEWSGKEFGMTEVVKELRKESHEIVYWSGYELNVHVNKQEFPETIFHDYYDARAGRPSPQVDDSLFPPPSEALIKKLYETESILLTMMEKRYEWMGVNQKKHLYYRYLQYWDGIIKKYHPEAFIMPSAPHTIYDIVIYGLAQLYGIKVIMFEHTAVYDHALVMNDYAIGSTVLKKQLEKDRGINFSVVNFKPDIKRYYQNQTDPTQSSTPEIIKQTLKRYSPKNVLKLKTAAVIKSIKNNIFLEVVLQRFLRLGKGNMPGEYKSVESKPDFSKRYIYVALHYQPECTTSPLGGIFVDQLLMIEMLSYCLPSGWLIYVKEHPFQWKPRGLSFFSFRYEGYYQAIARLKNVRLVPSTTDTFTLIQHSIAVVEGTAAWEGVLRGKPGIAFGYRWYRDCHGIFNVRDVASCQAALNAIQNGFTVDHQKIINYLGSFQKVILNSFRDAYHKKISPLDVAGNIANMVKLISDELSS